MASYRPINQRIFEDSWFVSLDPSEKLVFFVLLVKRNLAGVFEYPMKVMCFDTGFEEDTLKAIMKKFEIKDKILYYNNWVIIKNVHKYEDLSNPKIKRGIERILSKVPREIIAKTRDFGYPIDTLLIPDTYPSDALNLNLNLNLNRSTTSKKIDVVSKNNKKRGNNTLSPIVDAYFNEMGWEISKNPIYKRYLRSARDLFKVAGSVEAAVSAIQSTALWANEKNLSWTIDTAVKHYHNVKNNSNPDDWRMMKQ